MRNEKYEMKEMKKLIFISLCLFANLPLWAQRMDDVEQHTKYVVAVDEYCPAPGQFVNELPMATADDTPATMIQKCTNVLLRNAARLAEGKNIEPEATDDDDDYDASYLLTLGAWGGYITFHFDHSIANVKGQRDLLILGNSNRSAMTTLDGGASEPGIVMVSKDVNDNGLPDDPWYELSGSADVDSVGKMVYDYAVTYTKAPMQNIPWTDNRGGSGFVNRIGFHKQEYYPLWLSNETLTYTGTLLPPNGVDANGVGTNWVRVFLRYGYADNKPNDDTDANSFDFDWAVDANRQPVNLDFVDFVRVYTGVNQFCGWMGETSTEIAHVEDLHLDASLQAVRDAMTGIDDVRWKMDDGKSVVYNLKGQRMAKPYKGLYIKNGKKYYIK
jgi:hypothetical protein